MPGCQVLQKHPLSSLCFTSVSPGHASCPPPFLSALTYLIIVTPGSPGATPAQLEGSPAGGQRGMKKNRDIRRERLGPGATLRSGGDTRFSYTSEVWGGGGGLLRTWNSLATITSRRPACTRLSGLKRKQPSVLCPSAPGRLQHDGFANASTTGSVQTRLSAPWVPKLGRAGSGRSDSEHL